MKSLSGHKSTKKGFMVFFTMTLRPFIIIIFYLFYLPLTKTFYIALDKKKLIEVNQK